MPFPGLEHVKLLPPLPLILNLIFVSKALAVICLGTLQVTGVEQVLGIALAAASNDDLLRR